MVANLFGTDGIRGRVNLAVGDEKVALERLTEHRELSGPIMRLVGESLATSSQFTDEKNSRVVVGWDDRPANQQLVDYLTVGLNIAGFEVIHLGLCATPLLHYATLCQSANYGCMITASHNPVEDSGVKIFNEFGFKTTPEFELELSRNIYSLAQEDRDIDQIEFEKLAKPLTILNTSQHDVINHEKWLTQRYRQLVGITGTSLQDAKKLNQPLLIDSSKGSAKSWLADWLSSNGIMSVEVSKSSSMLNHNCGAGDFSPTQEWTFAEAINSEHVLLSKLSRCEPGLIVAAALDGDGDRCLLIESTNTGYRVIDGDRIADTFVNCLTNSGYDWHIAASIESDLSLTSNLNRFPNTVTASETAVGDRWLSHSLAMETTGALLKNNSLPHLIGVEDSGHIVLPSAHPIFSKSWSLVGDGAMTLTAYLLALTRMEPSSLMKRGWKQRQSVKDVDRSKWDGKNALAKLVENKFIEKLSQYGTIENWSKKPIHGESNLLLFVCNYSGAKLSLGVRNSGTQAKISVSARLEHGGSNAGLQEAIDSVCDILAQNMASH
tara:strand:+ start:938 stop:2587 length:1650 start_codon:yes stop_codon:yes gene_type:complete